ncbi:hypothetical protein LOD99_6368 [Oopsacas minuta]|uniref:Uncharacterized protein n=1 Tax=Oopsacas minuta TaxID=111878 RepID=A0AAV7JLZ4_9METZ|nr:hypothetical protein LOD99_6368 [Oopsacas minuta]
MTKPCDIKLKDDKIFVLSRKDNPCLYVFNLTDEILRSFNSHSMQEVRKCSPICCDTEYSDGGLFCWQIKVFSQEGTLLHILGDTQEEDKKINHEGIIVTNVVVLILLSSH